MQAQLTNKQFYKFLIQAANLLELKINKNLTNKIYTYFKSDGNIKHQPKWKIIRLMNDYDITSWDKFSNAIRKFNQKYAISEDGKVGYTVPWKK